MNGNKKYLGEALMQFKVSVFIQYAVGADGYIGGGVFKKTVSVITLVKVINFIKY
jgi:hypothetical protein